MKIPSITARLILIVSLVVLTSLEASLCAQQRTSRRGVTKQYTSPEEIQRRQDSINEIKYRLFADVVPDADDNETQTQAHTPKRATNSP